MDLTIIIVSYNTRELLKQCLNSIVQGLIRQRVDKVQSEIIVVDNGSRDGSVEMLRKLKVKLIENRENLGFAKAVNQGLREAQGEVILLLNSDTQVKKGALEKLLEFEEKVGPAIIGARLLSPDGSVQASVFHLPTLRGAIKEYWFGKTGEFSKYVPEEKKPLEVEAVIGGAMLISKAVVERIGLLDERYFMYFEDLDYCRRARKAGYKIYYLPEAEIVHEHGASGKNLAESKEQWRRLIPSSKIYHGVLGHYLINFVLWLGQKLK